MGCPGSQISLKQIPGFYTYKYQPVKKFFQNIGIVVYTFQQNGLGLNRNSGIKHPPEGFFRFPG